MGHDIHYPKFFDKCPTCGYWYTVGIKHEHKEDESINEKE